MSPKLINQFNHMYTDFLMGPKEMSVLTKKYTLTKEKRDEAI